MEKSDNRERGAAIVGNSLVPYVAGMSRQDKRDVNYSSRLARWGADSKYDRQTQSADWFLYYAGVLKMLGWVPSGDAITEVHHPNFSGSVVEAYLRTISGVGTIAVAQVTHSAVNALRADKPALRSFSLESVAGDDFQIMPVEYDSQQRLKMTVNHFRLSSTFKTEEFLFFKWQERSAKLVQSYGRFLLDRAIFEQNRAFLERRIKEIAISVFDLNLP
jgi:hypothetical protein